MNNLRFLTSGESHGTALIGIIEGLPSGLNISPDDIDVDLKRRQGGQKVLEHRDTSGARIHLVNLKIILFRLNREKIFMPAKG